MRNGRKDQRAQESASEPTTQNVVSPTLPCQSGRGDVLVQDTTMNERHKLSLVSGQREGMHQRASMIDRIKIVSLRPQAEAAPSLRSGSEETCPGVEDER